MNKFKAFPVNYQENNPENKMTRRKIRNSRILSLPTELISIILEKVEHEKILETLENTCNPTKPFRPSNYLIKTLRKSMSMTISPKFKQILIYAKIGLNLTQIPRDFDAYQDIKKLLGGLDTIRFSHYNTISRENLGKLSSVKRIIICSCRGTFSYYSDIFDDDANPEKTILKNITVEKCIFQTTNSNNFNRYFTLTFCGNRYHDGITPLTSTGRLIFVFDDSHPNPSYPSLYMDTFSYMPNNDIWEIINRDKLGKQSINYQGKFDKIKREIPRNNPNCKKYNPNKKRGNFKAKTYKRQNYNFR